MGRSQESFNKKEIRKKKEKKRKDKEMKRQARKESEKKSGLDDMIAYVDEHGMITSTPPDPAEKEEIKAEDIVIGVPSRSDDPDENAPRKGTVTFFNESKGFGFIKDLETKQDVFVHVNELVEEIREGNLVTFEITKGPKGLMATQVRLFKEEEK